MTKNTAANYALELIREALAEDYENTLEDLAEDYYTDDNGDMRFETQEYFEILTDTGGRMPGILDKVERMAKCEDNVEPLDRHDLEYLIYILLVFDDEPYAYLGSVKRQRNRARELSELLRQVDASKLFNLLNDIPRDAVFKEGFKKAMKQAITSQMAESDGFITLHVTGTKF